MYCCEVMFFVFFFFAWQDVALSSQKTVSSSATLQSFRHSLAPCLHVQPPQLSSALRRSFLATLAQIDTASVSGPSPLLTHSLTLSLIHSLSSLTRSHHSLAETLTQTLIRLLPQSLIRLLPQSLNQ